MKVRLALCMLVCVMAAGTGLAQSKDTLRPPREGGFWLFGGLHGGLFNFDNLNTHLQAAPLSFTDGFSSPHFMFGGGAMTLIGHVTLAGYGFGGRQWVESESLRLAASYGGGMFELGWLPVTTPNFMIGPGLGIGAAGFTLRATSDESFVPNFDTLMRHGAQAWEVNNERFALAPAMNILIPLEWTGISLKAGYYLTLFDKDWKMGSMELKDPPDLRASGPFAAVQLMLGSTDVGVHARRKCQAELRAAEEKRREEQRQQEELRKQQEELQRQQEKLKEQPQPGAEPEKPGETKDKE